MSSLTHLLSSFRQAAASEREKGTYFEELILTYLRHEASYRDLYSEVWTYADWAEQAELDKRDTGIDLVAKTAGTGEFHAIQCKLYAEDYRLQKSDIDSFFTASGKKPFAHRIIVSTNLHWSEHAEDALRDQQPPVSKIDLHDLENSQIDWGQFQPAKPPVLKPKKSLRDHQTAARDAVVHGLASHDRGKLIMACGTGKTFTSLKIAEQLAGAGKRVLFLVPSLALLSQSLTEWTQESATPLHSFAVCSDSDVGKKRKKDDDIVQTFTHELRYPATTDAARLAIEMTKRHDTAHMSVVFSTYHSIDVLRRAQKAHGLADFDLIICDEAHRTTGATFDDEDESNFVKVHDNHFIRSAKRLYMTATPRIYGEQAKASADKDNVTLCSMDDPALYGPELFVITFSEAVKRGLLVDYKVIVLAVEETHVNRRLQALLKDENNQLKVDDAAKIVGCWKALSKQGLAEGLVGDEAAMRRAVAFCQVIEVSKGAKTHKVSSKNIANMFQAVVEAYQATELGDEFAPDIAATLACRADHVDGGMNASEKEAKLTWLKAEPPENTCRILSNVRCLSEGVDVPALDAVLFLTPRNSQVDVVQSVGRVMRNAPGKKRGYVVLPVVIPAGVEPNEALNDNKTYKVVWQVLQALRSHDDRFDAMVNKLDLIGKDTSKMEVVAITDKVQKKPKKTAGTKNKDAGKGGFTIGAPKQRRGSKEDQQEIEFHIGEIEKAIYAKLVQKVGNRHHWEDWANDIAKIARTHIDRITLLLDDPANTKEREAFKHFATELRDDLNDSINDGEIIEMLAQHLITKPVFDALFEGYSFATNNPMSQAMQGVLDILQEHRLDKEADTLQAFYESVKLRAAGIDNAAGKQKIVVELYDKFFRNAFPKMTERLGIVYTPVEVVDFILHSVSDVLKTEFGQTLGSPGVHIIDPFTGTGTFITRLLHSGLISPEQLAHKYKTEIHANEIVLLAYYIAAINIEAVYHSLAGGDYQPFEGICLTDTFQMYEKDDLVDQLLVTNSARRKRQKTLDIRVIIGNPPYSVGQKSENDNNDNLAYPHLDGRIRNTYAERSAATNKKALYDSYIRAIRWASDRVGQSGVIGFVTNAGFLDANTADGLRKCLADEFSSLYVFHLRGNQRTAGELSRKEGGKIFGGGSRAPIAITLLVKNPDAAQHGQIHFHDIGDYLSREEKLETIRRFGSIAGITAAGGWDAITPDAHGDWLKQRDDSFADYIALGDKNSAQSTLFSTYSNGVKTQRDAWCYNASKAAVTANMTRMIAFYNQEAERFNAAHPGLESKKQREALIDDFIDTDATKIAWTRALKQELVKDRRFTFEPTNMVVGLYRPFTKHWLYFNRRFNEMVYQMPRFFPDASAENIVIGVSASESRSAYSVFISDHVASLHAVDMVGSQYFPLYLYDDPEGEPSTDEAPQPDLFGGAATPALTSTRTRRDAITAEGLAHFQAAYPGEAISREDVFYYVYGLLHSPDYRERFADNLGKELPRIPCVSSAADFRAFSTAGRRLAELHLKYEEVPMFAAKVEGDDMSTSPRLIASEYRVDKMRFGKVGKDKDLTTIHYNAHITVSGIPAEAYGYEVNGKPAIEWVMERQAVKTDKASGIINDANEWAIETMGNPRYPLELLLRVITVSIETMRIIHELPQAALIEEIVQNLNEAPLTNQTGVDFSTALDHIFSVEPLDVASRTKRIDNLPSLPIPEAQPRFHDVDIDIDNITDHQEMTNAFPRSGPSFSESQNPGMDYGKIEFHSSEKPRLRFTRLTATEVLDIKIDTSTFLSQSPSKEFNFTLKGDGARGTAIAENSKATLVFQHDHPTLNTLLLVINEEMDAMRKSDVDIYVNLTAYGNLLLSGKRNDIAHFKNGQLVTPLFFSISATEADDKESGIHVSFSANCQTIHQIDMPIAIVPDSAASTTAIEVPQGHVPLSLMNDAAHTAPPPPDLITLNLSLEQGFFVINAMHFKDNQIEWNQTAIVQNLDAATLASQLLEVLEPLDGCYQSDGWIGFDGDEATITSIVKSALNDAMLCAAEAGSKLNDALRSYEKIVPILDYIERMPDGTRITIATRDVFLPWELLYPLAWSRYFTDEQKAENPLTPTRFWGARFAVETVPNQGKQYSSTYTTHLSIKQRQICVNVNPTITAPGQPSDKQPLQIHQNWATELNEQNKLNGQIRNKCNDMRNVLQNGNHEASLIYVYCHGSASQPFGGQSELLELDDGCKLDPSALTGRTTKPYATAPIVFLNACETGRPSPLAYSQFLRAFQDRGAIGLIATTCSVPITFAAHFGREVVQAYLTCKGSFAASLRALRHKHISLGNPVPLFYTLQCQLTIPLSSSDEATT